MALYIEKNRRFHQTELYIPRADLVSRVLIKGITLSTVILTMMFVPMIEQRAQISGKTRKQSRQKPATRDSRSQPVPSPLTVAESENLRLQRDRLDFDKDKAKSDADRAERSLSLEKSKVFWSALATAVPLLAGAAAIFFGFLNQKRQAKHQFELKAAEIIFSGTTPQAILGRGKALKRIFNKQLSSDFLGDLEPKDIGGEKEPVESKLVFFDHLLKNPDKKADIVSLWFHLFPWDYKWLVRIDPEQFKDSDLPEIQEALANLKVSKQERT